MEEEWRNIENFEGYQVSNLGNVRSYIYPSHYGRQWRDEPHLLKTSLDDRGRPCVYLYGKDKRFTRRVSRLVGEAFIPNPNSYNVLRHYDDDPQNNCVDNLLWGTHSDNTKDSIRNGTFYRSKLNKPVVATNAETGETLYFKSHREAAKFFDRAENTISASVKDHNLTSGYYIEDITKEIYESEAVI